MTYRAVAAKAGVTPGLVQYYFPTLDDLFVAAIRRRSGQNLARLAEALRHARRPAAAGAVGVQPGRVDRGAHHRVPRPRQPPQVDPLGDRRGHRAGPAPPARRARERRPARGRRPSGRLSPSALLFLLTGIPKLIRLEEGVGVSTRPRRGGEGVRAVPRRRSSPARKRSVGRPSQPTSAGIESQPRTVERRGAARLLMSISHSGNRFSTSSRAMRPSRRARAAPRQKCDAVAERHVLADRCGGCRIGPGPRSGARPGWPRPA